MSQGFVMTFGQLHPACIKVHMQVYTCSQKLYRILLLKFGLYFTFINSLTNNFMVRIILPNITPPPPLFRNHMRPCNGLLSQKIPTQFVQRTTLYCFYSPSYQPTRATELRFTPLLHFLIHQWNGRGKYKTTRAASATAISHTSAATFHSALRKAEHSAAPSVSWEIAATVLFELWYLPLLGGAPLYDL